MLLDLLFLVGGLALLFLGAEVLVRGAAALALRLGISALVVGLTVVAFGTSAPELVVSVQAALSGVSGIAVGNVVGSNIANIALILGVSALIRPIRVQARLVRLDLPLLIVVTALLAVLLWDRSLATWEGLLLGVGFLGFLSFNLWQAQRDRPAAPVLAGAPDPGSSDPDDSDPDDPGVTAALATPEGSLWRDALFVVGGLILLVVGSHGLLRGAVAVAEAAGLPAAVIGLTLVAIGTSLPELATSVMAAFRGAGDIAIGNVVGSNLFNALGILGIAALVRPLTAPGLTPLDTGAMMAAALLMLPLAWSGFVLSRREGALLVTLYGVYTVLLLG